MIVPDANLLLYAYDSSSPFHARSRRWWERCLSGREPVGLTHPVLFAFVRLATNRRVYDNPLPLPTVAEHVQSWVARRVTRILLPGVDHTDRVISLLHAAGSAGGNLVTDAQIAALAVTYNAVVYTADQDFRRFPGIDCAFPLADQHEDPQGSAERPRS